MPRKLLLIFSMLLLSVAVFAQDWTGVPRGGRTYYTTLHITPPTFTAPAIVDSFHLRVIYIDSSRAAVAGDSVHHFWRSLRLDSLYGCADTLAPSWMGYRMISSADGRERYFNSYGDTISIQTSFGLSGSWILAKDTFGRLIHGTITSIGVDTLDGMPDSVKTITLSTSLFGFPVNGYYSGKQLKLSQHHGWVQCFEMWGFPNGKALNTRVGVETIPSAHTRVNLGVVTQLPPCWEYGAGSEWITESVHTGLNEAAGFLGAIDWRLLQHDSVLYSSNLGNDLWSVTMQRTWSFFKRTTQNFTVLTDTFYTGDSTLTFTAHSTPAFQSALTVMPEIVQNWRVGGHGYYSGDGYRYFSYSKDTGRYYSLSSRRRDWQPLRLALSAGCVQSVGAIQGYAFTEYDSVLGTHFALNRFVIKPDPGVVFVVRETTVPYRKSGSCTYGAKFNILGINDLQRASGFVMAPNPADKQTFFTLPVGVKGAVLRIADCTGRTFLERRLSSGKNTVSVEQLPPGLYIATVTSPGSTQQSVRLLVSH